MGREHPFRAFDGLGRQRHIVPACAIRGVTIKDLPVFRGLRGLQDSGEVAHELFGVAVRNKVIAFGIDDLIPRHGLPHSLSQVLNERMYLYCSGLPSHPYDTRSIILIVPAAAPRVVHACVQHRTPDTHASATAAAFARSPDTHGPVGTAPPTRTCPCQTPAPACQTWQTWQPALAAVTARGGGTGCRAKYCSSASQTIAANGCSWLPRASSCA